jgi:nitroreductase
MPDFFDVVRSQRGVRLYKPDPVPDEAIEQILRAAVRAPSASNRQTWRFIVIRDRAVKRELGRLYLEGQRRGRNLPSTPTPPPGEPLSFAFAMEEVPVLIMACMDRVHASRPSLNGASIYPAFQNLMLAAAALGLGTRLTTIWHNCDKEVAELLGIPDEYEAMALTPLGYPMQPDHLGGSKRKPISEVTYYDKWGQTAR